MLKVISARRLHLNAVLLVGLRAVARQDYLSYYPGLPARLGLDDDFLVHAKFCFKYFAHGISVAQKKEPPAEAGGMVLSEGLEPSHGCV